LAKYYQLQRRADHRDAARTTIRLLESLIRLAQAHAKLTWCDQVGEMDAVAAIILMEASLQTLSVLGGQPDIYSGPSDDPDDEFRGQMQHVLRKLEVNPAVLQGETTGVPVLNLDAEAEELLCTWAPTQQ